MTTGTPSYDTTGSTYGPSLRNTFSTTLENYYAFLRHLNDQRQKKFSLRSMAVLSGTLLSGEAARKTISSQFHCPQPGCRSEVPDKTATLRRRNGIQYGVRLLGRTLCYTFLLLCGDVMVNPSPRDKSQISSSGRFARGLCYRAVSRNDQSLCCDECGR